MWRGQPSNGVPSRLKRSQKTRATGMSSGCQGRSWKVFGSGRARTSDLLDPAEAVDGGAVEGHALLESVLELGRGDAERLGRAEDVGEPELDEADGPFLDGPEDVLLLASHAYQCRRRWAGPGHAFTRRSQMGNGAETRRCHAGTRREPPARASAAAVGFVSGGASHHHGAGSGGPAGPGAASVGGGPHQAIPVGAGRDDQGDRRTTTKEDPWRSGPRRKYSAW